MNWPGTFFSGPHALVDAYCWSKLKTRDYARFVADGNRCHVVQIIRVCFTSGRVTSGHQFLRDPWIGWWLNWTATGKSGSKKSLLIEQVVLHHLVIWLDHSWCYTEKICVSRQINTWIKWIKKHMDFSFTLLQRGFEVQRSKRPYIRFREKTEKFFLQAFQILYTQRPSSSEAECSEKSSA